jgi:trk system potassium uptake protein TrkH
MNIKKILKILGKIMILEGILMIAPLVVSILYKEKFINILAFIVPIFILVSIGFLLQILKPKRNNLYQKEGFALVALVWLVMALFGAIPFVINKDIPNYINAFFETISGFSTTGASIITDITKISHSSLFWRSFTHWIGGMGILVFILIFIPESNEGSSLHLLKAESSGPQVGKIVSKMKVTTRILYSIYLGMTVLEIIILMLDDPIPGYESDHLFFSFLTAFGCAGTGGFGFIPGSMELFSPFSQYVIATFLILFGVNFSLYYLILIGKIKDVLKSEELKTYFAVFWAAVGIIFFSLLSKGHDLIQVYTTEEAFRHSYFQVASIMTTAGFSTTDFGVWPVLAITVLMIVMLTGAMAGSTAGGMKLSRIVIGVKGIGRNIKKLINPRYVSKTKIENKQLEESIINDVFAFFTLYFLILFVCVLLLSFDPVNGTIVKVVSESGVGEYTVKHGFMTNFSSSIAALSNIGPGFEAVGPYSSYAYYSGFSKVILSLVMLIGRLEILPVLILFSPRTWKK